MLLPPERCTSLTPRQLMRPGRASFTGVVFASLHSRTFRSHHSTHEAQDLVCGVMFTSLTHVTLTPLHSRGHLDLSRGEVFVTLTHAVVDAFYCVGNPLLSGGCLGHPIL